MSGRFASSDFDVIWEVDECNIYYQNIYEYMILHTKKSRRNGPHLPDQSTLMKIWCIVNIKKIGRCTILQRYEFICKI
jgi:hypothetical protein